MIDSANARIAIAITGKREGMNNDGALASSQDRSSHEDRIHESQSSEDVEVLDGTGLAVGRVDVPELNPGVGWYAFAGSILAQFVPDCFQAGQYATPSNATPS